MFPRVVAIEAAIGIAVLAFVVAGFFVNLRLHDRIDNPAAEPAGALRGDR